MLLMKFANIERAIAMTGEIAGLVAHDLAQITAVASINSLTVESANFLAKISEQAVPVPVPETFTAPVPAPVHIALPEKVPVRPKHALTPTQIPGLLELLKEPARTMVRLGILTGMRVGEILGLRRTDVDFLSGQIRIEQANYRGIFGTPKTKGSKRSLPMPRALVAPLARACGHHSAHRRRALNVSNHAMANHSAIRISCTGI
jgi:integrase